MLFALNLPGSLLPGLFSGLAALNPPADRLTDAGPQRPRAAKLTEGAALDTCRASGELDVAFRFDWSISNDSSRRHDWGVGVMLTYRPGEMGCSSQPSKKVGSTGAVEAGSRGSKKWRRLDACTTASLPGEDVVRRARAAARWRALQCDVLPEGL